MKMMKTRQGIKAELLIFYNKITLNKPNILILHKNPDISHYFPEIMQDASQLHKKLSVPFIANGIMLTDSLIKPSGQLSGSAKEAFLRLRLFSPGRIASAAKKHPACFYAYDMFALGLDYEQRMDVLHELIIPYNLEHIKIYRVKL